MSNVDNCEIYCFDEVKVKRLQGLLETVDISSITKMFKALADDTRMKIAYSLCEEDELCVCDVANITGSSLATASHHLRLLRNMGLAKYRKEGKLVFYSIDDEQIKQFILLAFAHSEEGKVYAR
ncbi:metalloregulator ArsR/SmtB family transcription factor [Paenibacillus chondroitinus]|uniref:Metalloregulator ArsR/SmtB family transcription factor n=1 Tax=Paenibacillus chondroitinus TaxID=59842 RepID=A0ABU6DGN7_9BACL|nr:MULTISPECIES: metalloregulator ArsR/SmtB family transcription factor [Paenibacillus]MCY9659508.1 metalloregulator ArsR/SmtB family transcription factor [Paenibacillus anseongense]MEB4796903.1 metalloregulator ArsR/SmtB family transcription factor [Paenibacillus chondroitinus]